MRKFIYLSLLVIYKDSPPAALESQRTQSWIAFSLSAERPESEKQQPFGQSKGWCWSL